MSESKDLGNIERFPGRDFSVCNLIFMLLSKAERYGRL
jgi:hypothetical protein